MKVKRKIKDYSTYEGRCRQCNKYGNHCIILELCKDCIKENRKIEELTDCYKCKYCEPNWDLLDLSVIIN